MGNQSSKPKAKKLKNTKEYQNQKQVKAGFQIFQELPPEIRFKIWRATLAPRIVDFQWNHTYSKQHFWKLKKTCSNSPARPDICYRKPNVREVVRTEVRSPAILSVCRESRNEALRRYIPLKHCSLTGCYPYFDPEVDTVFFNASSFDMYCSCCADLTYDIMAFSRPMVQQIWSKVQILALHDTLFDAFCSSRAIYDCKNLKQLIIVPKERERPECYKKWKRNPVEAERCAGLVVPYLQGQRAWAAEIKTKVDLARERLRVRYSDWIEPEFRCRYWSRSIRTVFVEPEGENVYEEGMRVQLVEVDGSIFGDPATTVIMEMDPLTPPHAWVTILLNIVRRGTDTWG